MSVISSSTRVGRVNSKLDVPPLSLSGFLFFLCKS